MSVPTSIRPLASLPYDLLSQNSYIFKSYRTSIVFAAMSTVELLSILCAKRCVVQSIVPTITAACRDETDTANLT